MLKLYLLGPPRVELGEAPVQIRRRKALALLAYLAVTSRPHSRDALATLFYPDLDQSRARAYFRRDLGALNAHLEGDWLAADRELVGMNRPADLWTDVAAFRDALAARDEHGHADDEVCPDCLPLLVTAAELYADDFLAGFSLPDCPEFDEWQFFEAENLRGALAAAIERLIAIHVQSGRYEDALPFARRRLKLDPLHEPAHRDLMTLYALAEQQAAALRQYQNAVALLDEELGVAPEEETTRLYEEIKARRLGQQGAQVDSAVPEQPAAATPAAGPSYPAFLTKDGAQEHELTAFVARDRQLSQLKAALESAKRDRGRVLFIVGGAGQGKTALVQEFARRAQDEDPDLVVVSGFCKAIVGIGDPYLPFREALTMLTGDVEARQASGWISQKHARQLWELMPLTLPALLKFAPDLIDRFVPAEALQERAAQSIGGHSPWLNQIATLSTTGQSGSLHQTAIFAQYAAMLKAVASQRPLVLIIEDLHWMDAASSALLFHLSKEIGDSQILLVGTYRPEELAQNGSPASGTGFQVQHPMAGIVSEIKRERGDVWLDLGDPPGAERQDFVEAYLDTQPNRLDVGFREALFRRTEGHALFTVELIRAMQERGDLCQDEDGYWIPGKNIDWTTLPVKVEGVIERRIKRLPESLQSILTTASVEGETFTAEVVARVHQVDERTLVRQLSGELDKQHHLVLAKAIEWLIPGRQRLSIYRFQHQLFQHYLYHQLDEVERGYLHEAVGNSLEELYAGRTEEIAGQLAYHFQEVGLVAKAIHYLMEAGDAAAAVHANIEAAAHYGRAVELAEEAEIGSEELARLYVSLGGQLMVTKGDGAPEVGQAYGRALELYGPSGESPQRFDALRGLSLYHKLRGESATACRLSEEMLTQANALEDPVLVVEAYYAMGSHHFYAGNLEQAWTYLEQGINSYDQQQHGSLIPLYGQDPGVANLCYACLVLWLLGYPDQALKRSTEALTLAKELDHPYSLAMAHIWSAWLHFYRRESQVILAWTETAIRLAEKHNFTIFLGVGKLLRGWALIEQGSGEEGISEVQQGMATAVLAIGSEEPRTEWPAVLADSYRKLEKPQRGLNALSEAFVVSEESPNLEWGQPELYRLKGEMLLQQGNADQSEAETCFQQAMSIARQQGAKSLELRAAMSLSRLWQSQGKREEAYRALTTAHEWFVEGFETLDLQEARTLLKELA